MTGKELRDKLCKDDEFLDLLSMVRDTNYAKQNCIYQIDGGSKVVDFDSASDIEFIITLIANYVKQLGSMTDQYYENFLMKIVKQFLFSTTVLFYIWNNVTTATYIDSYSKTKYGLSFASKSESKTKGRYDSSITFSVHPGVHPGESYTVTHLYVKPKTVADNKSLDPVDIGVIVSKDVLTDFTYLQIVRLYFGNIKKGRGFEQVLPVNTLNMQRIMRLIKDASTLNFYK